MKPDPSLLDHLLSLMPEQDAFDVHLWAQHPWAVRTVMEEGEWSSDYSSGCSSCNADLEYRTSTHKLSCKWVQALAVLNHPRLQRLLVSAEYAADACWAEGDIYGFRPEVGHFADATTRELQQEAAFTDSNGVYHPPPYEDY